MACGGFDQRSNGVTKSDRFDPGALLGGRYIVRRVLGQGGFGITYEAEGPNKERLAIKEYFPSAFAERYQDGSVAPKRGWSEAFKKHLREFRAESEALSAFDHPNIVTVLSRFDANGTSYFVMDYVAGESLADTLARLGALSTEAVMLIAENLLEGVKVVHDQGRLHRDIKPGNIILAHVDAPRPTRLDVSRDIKMRFGRPVLIDFGAVRHVGAGGRSMTGIVTPGFGAPEQSVDRGHQDVRTDLYGVAATLYSCLDGQPPPPALERKERDTLTPASRRFAGRAPAAFLSTIDLALSLRPDKRPKNVRAFRAALFADAHLFGQAAPAPSPSPSPTLAQPAPAPPYAPPRAASPPKPIEADATGFAPKKLRRGTTETVQVIVHHPGDAGAVAKGRRDGVRARNVQPGASVCVLLEVQGAHCDTVVQRRSWRGGEPIAFDFAVEPDMASAKAHLRAHVLVNDAAIGVVAFTRAITDSGRSEEPGRERIARHRRVFVSSAPTERDLVEPISLAYRAMGVEPVWDRARFALGGGWPEQLRAELERADLFHLCWSSASAASLWVERETEHALRLSQNGARRPALLMQMLEGPPWPRQPPGLNGPDFDALSARAFAGLVRLDE
ncbi:MAG: protein kinase [Alphaproteobacteria bacterium]|nr:protein kinase [Alphaproteobacteria bacterium]